MNIAWRVHIFGKLFDVLIFSRKSVFKPFNFLENYYENMRPKKTNYHKLYKYIYYLHFMQDIEEKKKSYFLSFNL